MGRAVFSVVETAAEGLSLIREPVASHLLLKILSTFLAQLFTASILVAVVTPIPFAVFVALIGLELAVSVIQAYVFCVLACSYIHQGRNRTSLMYSILCLRTFQLPDRILTGVLRERHVKCLSDVFTVQTVAK
jgi:hypothetical protein